MANGILMQQSVLLLILTLCGCAEGRWVSAEKSRTDAEADWERCKVEALAGVEHQKDTMAGGINIAGCMQAKGYRYVEDQQPPAADGPAAR